MAYRVVRNNRTGKRTLEFYQVFQRKVLGARGSFDRRIIQIDGRPYHVTKGWRKEKGAR